VGVQGHQTIVGHVDRDPSGLGNLTLCVEKERKTRKREKEGQCKTKRLQSDASNPLKMQTQTNKSQTNITKLYCLNILK